MKLISRWLRDNNSQTTSSLSVWLVLACLIILGVWLRNWVLNSKAVDYDHFLSESLQGMIRDYNRDLEFRARSNPWIVTTGNADTIPAQDSRQQGARESKSLFRIAALSSGISSLLPLNTYRLEDDAVKLHPNGIRIRKLFQVIGCGGTFRYAATRGDLVTIQYYAFHGGQVLDSTVGGENLTFVVPEPPDKRAELQRKKNFIIDTKIMAAAESQGRANGPLKLQRQEEEDSITSAFSFYARSTTPFPNWESILSGSCTGEIIEVMIPFWVWKKSRSTLDALIPPSSKKPLYLLVFLRSIQRKAKALSSGDFEAYEEMVTQTTITRAKLGQSCTDACASLTPPAADESNNSTESVTNPKQMRCVEEAFVVVNQCPLLKANFPCTVCEVAALGSSGPDMPCYVSPAAPLGHPRGYCMVSPNPKGSQCDAKYQHTVRLCPCSPLDP